MISPRRKKSRSVVRTSGLRTVKHSALQYFADGFTRWAGIYASGDNSGFLGSPAILLLAYIMVCSLAWLTACSIIGGSSFYSGMGTLIFLLSRLTQTLPIAKASCGMAFRYHTWGFLCRMVALRCPSKGRHWLLEGR
jgi:hypothetical protein